jgi:hypothetical protein
VALNPEPEGRAKTGPVRRPQAEGPVSWAFGSSGHTTSGSTRTARFYSTAPAQRPSDTGAQGIGSAVIDVMPGDYIGLIARQTSGTTKHVAADELTWFAIEVVE